MNIEAIRDYCLRKPLATEDMPFGEETVVFRVKDKIFALLNISGNFWINLKCDPDLALELREKYSHVRPGYHMNKRHWNTVDIDETLEFSDVKEWIDHSYLLIVNKLPKKDKEEVKALFEDNE